MHYEIIFRVPMDQSGYATYMAKKYETSSYNYQFERPNNFSAQQFIFYDINSMNQFIKTMVEKLGDNFIIESIENQTIKEEKKG